MNFSIKKSVFLVLMSMMSLAAMAQVEVKVNPIGALFNSPDISVEYIATDNIGVEGRVGYTWSNISVNETEYQSKGLVFIGAGRYYFNPNAGGDKLYVGAYTKFKNVAYTTALDSRADKTKRQRLAVGPMFGYKILSGNERVSLDINLGVGRALMVKNTNATDDFLNDVAITKLDLISTLAVGYRF